MRTSLLLAIPASLALAGQTVAAQAVAPVFNIRVEEVPVTRKARGTFDVKLTPATMHSPELGRMTIDKELHGDLEAVSAGEMLSAMTGVKGSAGYVAMELVKGTLHGRKGSFVLQHSATMNRGAPDLTVVVVPDSGTEELTGLTGRFKIIIEGGKHSYEFEYTLPD